MVKASKIEGMPKRPMSAYFLWMGAEGREAAKKSLGQVGVAEISKECGSMWREIDESTKKKYDVEYPKWLADGGKELLDAAKKEKKGKAAKKAAGKAKGRGRASKKKAESEEEEDEESEEDDE